MGGEEDEKEGMVKREEENEENKVRNEKKNKKREYTKHK